MTPNLLPEFIHGMPEVFLIMWALVVLMVGVFQKRSEREGVYYITFVGIGLALFMLYSSFGNYAYSFNEMFKVTPFTQLMKGVVLLAVGAVFYMTFKHFPREQMNRFEYPVLVLISSVGMMIMISANDLISAFLGIEMQSLCLYIMVSIARDRPASGEAGIKYFVLGALATARRA